MRLKSPKTSFWNQLVLSQKSNLEQINLRADFFNGILYFT